MQPQSIEQRVTVLEQQMQEMRELPERVTNLESQILQFRQEMRGWSSLPQRRRGVRGPTIRGEPP